MLNPQWAADAGSSPNADLRNFPSLAGRAGAGASVTPSSGREPGARLERWLCFSSSHPRGVNLGGLHKLGWVLLTGSVHHSETSELWEALGLVAQARYHGEHSRTPAGCPAPSLGLHAHFLTHSPRDLSRVGITSFSTFQRGVCGCPRWTGQAEVTWLMGGRGDRKPGRSLTDLWGHLVQGPQPWPRIRRIAWELLKTTQDCVPLR